MLPPIAIRAMKHGMTIVFPETRFVRHRVFASSCEQQETSKNPRTSLRADVESALSPPHRRDRLGGQMHTRVAGDIAPTQLTQPVRRGAVPREVPMQRTRGA